jgi:hypothetical protein
LPHFQRISHPSLRCVSVLNFCPLDFKMSIFSAFTFIISLLLVSNRVSVWILLFILCAVAYCSDSNPLREWERSRN